MNKLSKDQIAAAVIDYKNGHSLALIARRFDVTRQSMHDLLKRRIPMRPQQRYGSENHFYRGSIRADGKAQNLVEQALRKGLLLRPKSCELCQSDKRAKDGRSLIQAHHCDYQKPLEVMWLCQKCHHRWHKTNKAKNHGFA